MLGRAALADPALPIVIARELGLTLAVPDPTNWETLFRQLLRFTEFYGDRIKPRELMRLKQWLKIAHSHGEFKGFDVLKHAETVDEFFELLVA